MNKKGNALFVTGIGTNVGKTVCSAILTEYFKADYWKPIQSGDLNHSDTMRVRELVSNHTTVFHPEAHRLQLAASPHKSAACEKINIEIGDFKLPTDGPLIIEGAGGLMVPLNTHFFMIDLIQHFQAKVALVTRDYLGCINHTLLSLEALEYRTIRPSYLILNGPFDPDTEAIIRTRLNKETLIIRIPTIKTFTKKAITDCVLALNNQKL